MPFQHRGSPAANADAAGHGGRAPVRPGQRPPSPAALPAPCMQPGGSGASQAASGREARTCLRRCTGQVREEGYAEHAGILPGPPVVRPQIPNRRFTMRKGCSTLERTDALFLDSTFSPRESVQSRPFMVEGFLATVQRIERWGTGGDFGALRHACVAGVRIAERVNLPHEGMRHGHVGHVCGGRSTVGARGRCRHRRRYAPCIRNASSCPSWTGAPRIACGPCSRGARRLDEGSIHDGAALIIYPRLLEGTEIAECTPCLSPPLEDMAEPRGSSRPAPVPA